jgi:hypothetical protein
MQIKFRGKCIYNHDYVYGYAVKDKRSTTNWYIVTEDEEEYVEVEADSVAQFTGVKSGDTEIYTDDGIITERKVVVNYSTETHLGVKYFTGRINEPSICCTARSIEELEKKLKSFLKITSIHINEMIYQTFEFKETDDLNNFLN